MKERREKPIRVFYSPLSNKFYATKYWTCELIGSNSFIRITGRKYDVTDDIASAVLQHDIEFSKVDMEVLHEGVS